MSEHPTWLKVMQNGSLGETRTKALLIDRFWILERSVDIQGADFIIQRRVTQQNLLDTRPPRLGVVQAKFFESEATSQYVHKEYVVDLDCQPRDEFFLIAHTGIEENSKIYFLTAKMIVENFSIADTDGAEKYRLPGKIVLNDPKYLLGSRKYALDRIENQLKLADFTKNRMFISWQLPKSVNDFSAIQPDFAEPLDNWWGDIPDEFKKLKETSYKAMNDIEEVYEKLKLVTEETDPIKALEIMDDLRSDLRDGNNKWSISLPDLYDPEFESVCHEHIERVNKLRERGLLDTFINLRGKIRDSAGDFLSKNLPIDSNTVHSMVINFSIKDFTIFNIEHKLTPIEIYHNIPHKINQFGHIDLGSIKYSGLTDISEGNFEYYWLAGRIHIDKKENIDFEHFYRTKVFSVYYECIEKMYYEWDY
ncbi:hypothetical protein [Mucilaginibacter panaciglaebae]|uniref:DUF4365 domain-containing protein n=1 Tax=Mucilaginibacter panaciglaebae TaxID=502331 RepID=A0ABP7WBA5_9SPHI